MKFLWPIALIFGIAYAWAGLSYSYFRFRGTETEEKWQRFLERYFDYFVHTVVGEPPTVVTPSLVRKKGANGWNFLVTTIGLVILLFIVNDAISPWYYLLFTALLFFAGLFFALSWYGQRCLRCLEIEGYSKGQNG
ncbi:MAG: hypothetical protein KDN20_04880 [Verrucomicrobiae bacterium]|nr:hypothetical protein [Verrucomicrobiae bacterium]